MTPNLNDFGRDVAAIIASPVFKLINYEIDWRLADLQHQCALVFHSTHRDPRFRPNIRTRTTYEETDGVEVRVELPLVFPELERIAECAALAIRRKAEIDGLQRVKLKLLGDWDFTHGDDSLADLVFGETLPK